MPVEVVRQAVWQSKHVLSLDNLSQVAVRNLQVSVQAGVDSWGRKSSKKQPALVSVTLSLAQPFDTAATADALDNSTVHYGHLSKTLKSLVEGTDYVTTEKLVASIESSALAVAGKAEIRAIEVDVCYPKASMLGDGAGFISSNLRAESTVSRILYLKNVRVPCIIGVNANERQQKQPVVVNLWIEALPEARGDDYAELEDVVVKAISESSFETLESLSSMVVEELRSNFFRTEADQGAYIRLRVEKPMAVPFADAPSIEILRPVRA